MNWRRWSHHIPEHNLIVLNTFQTYVPKQLLLFTISDNTGKIRELQFSNSKRTYHVCKKSNHILKATHLPIHTLSVCIFPPRPQFSISVGSSTIRLGLQYNKKNQCTQKFNVQFLNFFGIFMYFKAKASLLCTVQKWDITEGFIYCTYITGVQ